MVQPHKYTYTRLARSRRHGIGVFAIRNIPRGTLVFAPDDEATVKIRKATVDKLPRAIRRLYHDFCVLRGRAYECPVSFNKLTPAWYLNDSGEDEPNVVPDRNLRLRALRDIKAGEELLAKYSDYSQNESASAR
jgi:uncharacterized protein